MSLDAGWCLSVAALGPVPLIFCRHPSVSLRTDDNCVTSIACVNYAPALVFDSVHHDSLSLVPLGLSHALSFLSKVFII